MKQSRTKDIFILGFAMFAIFFGAGNLIFPPSIGIHSGGDVVWGIAGMTPHRNHLPHAGHVRRGQYGYGLL